MLFEPLNLLDCDFGFFVKLENLLKNRHFFSQWIEVWKLITFNQSNKSMNSLNVFDYITTFEKVFSG